ncbi:hypothetical protein GYMLUDRAFT_243985 [Collybiopsis luxurians FD-317 M1]|uniref:Uncharacterized protein n=1 Tax=Collybiopsis luxurians FD-317 M1 TaxID=944289 RepID=A0A0D0BAS5_9AGAR|nr:hypothetical protein GYMLUDRAFT_243985 [Collybiopsis luxurians FD-317 M1]
MTINNNLDRTLGTQILFHKRLDLTLLIPSSLPSPSYPSPKKAIHTPKPILSLLDGAQVAQHAVEGHSLLVVGRGLWGMGTGAGVGVDADSVLWDDGDEEGEGGGSPAALVRIDVDGIDDEDFGGVERATGAGAERIMSRVCDVGLVT